MTHLVPPNNSTLHSERSPASHTKERGREGGSSSCQTAPATPAVIRCSKVRQPITEHLSGVVDLHPLKVRTTSVWKDRKQTPLCFLLAYPVLVHKAVPNQGRLKKFCPNWLTVGRIQFTPLILGEPRPSSLKPRDDGRVGNVSSWNREPLSKHWFLSSS